MVNRETKKIRVIYSTPARPPVARQIEKEFDSVQEAMTAPFPDGYTFAFFRVNNRRYFYNSDFHGWESRPDWTGFEVPTHEAVWHCIKCEESPQTAESVDRVDFLMEFEVLPPFNKPTQNLPAKRKLSLRTSLFKITEDEGFHDFLRLVIEGQMIETDPWDRFIEVYDYS